MCSHTLYYLWYAFMRISFLCIIVCHDNVYTHTTIYYYIQCFIYGLFPYTDLTFFYWMVSTRTFTSSCYPSPSPSPFFPPPFPLYIEPTNMLDLKAIMWLEDYLQVFSTIFIVILSHSLKD